MAVIPNPARVEVCKEIDLVSLLPDHLLDTSTEEFLQLFQDYLNEMYVADCPDVATSALDDIQFTNAIIWTDGNDILTSRFGNFLTVFKAGDLIKRSGEDTFYTIANIIDDETLQLSIKYSRPIGSAIVVKAFYDNFITDTFRDFWDTTTTSSPDGNDGLIKGSYSIDLANDRITNTVDGILSSKIASTLEQNIVLEFGFHLAEGSNRNNEFGFVLTKGAETTATAHIKVLYKDGTIKVFHGGTEFASYPIKSDVDDFVVRFTRNVTDCELIFELEDIKTSDLTAVTWSDNIVGGEGLPIIGHFNRWKIVKTAVLGIDKSNDFGFHIINGLKQGFNYVDFRADGGFKGELDPSSTLVPDGLRIHGFYGRAFIAADGNIYVAFVDDNSNLRIRLLFAGTGETATAREFKKGLTKISILEKVKRLTELHDPDLIDIDFIQHFANYLGYNVTLSRQDLGIIIAQNADNEGIDFDTLSDSEQKEIENKYLRFIVRNLPNWYRIKTTRSAINVLLYSFGLIADLQHFFTNNYANPNAFILEGISNNEIPNSHFRTPHFMVTTDLDKSLPNFTLDTTKLNSIIETILSVKPINTVFRGLNGFLRRQFIIYIGMYASTSLFITIPFSTPLSDFLWQDTFGLGEEILDTFGIGEEIVDVFP